MNGDGQRPFADGPPVPRWCEWGALVRCRWWIALPFVTVGLGGVVAAYRWPALYRSEALILIERQKVPEQYVTPNVISDLQYRLDSMTQQMLSRTRLQRLVERYGLDGAGGGRLTTDEVIDRTRKNIQVALVQAPGRNNERALTAFRISFQTGDPRTAQRVVNELTSMFIDQNIEARTQQSVSTTTFLENQLELARQDLTRQEARLREYKTRYLGELPEQEQGNLHILQSLEAQLQMAAATLDRAEQQKVYLESLRSEYQNLRKALTGREPPPSTDPRIAVSEDRLREKRQRLVELQARFTAQHPDVRSLQKEIDEAEKALEKARQPEAETPAEGEWRGEAAGGTTDRALLEVESRLKVVAIEIAESRADTEELRRRIQEVQRRIAMTPLREQELAEVTRNYENSNTYYHSLLQKKLGSELATNLEKRQQGEQFRILDPASLPTRPTHPNRVRVVLGGWVVGLGIGLGLSLLREMTDSSIRSEKDLPTDSAAAAFLVRIPVLRSARETARRRSLRTLEAVSMAGIVLSFVGTSLHTYLTN